MAPIRSDCVIFLFLVNHVQSRLIDVGEAQLTAGDEVVAVGALLKTIDHQSPPLVVG